jgi:hypothetical protein
VLVFVGGLLSLGRVSFAFEVEGREMRQRVAAVDHRQPTTESGAVVAPQRTDEPATTATEPLPDAPAKPPAQGRRKG